MDGGAPEFRDFTGLAVYAPAWLAEDEPYVMVSSDGQLRAINSKTGKNFPEGESFPTSIAITCTLIELMRFV